MGGAAEEAPEEQRISAGLRGAGLQGEVHQISHTIGTPLE